MRITEAQLRKLVRQVIAEETMNEGIKDNTLLTAAALVLTAVGMFNAIKGDHTDIARAQQVIDKPGVEMLQPDIVQQVQSADGGMTGMGTGAEQAILNQHYKRKGKHI